MLANAQQTYLDTLNPQQRRAVEHGVGCDGTVGSPLLVIAGAGSGKTNTLAHRVAHLVATGADPQRILLLTFTRRAAAEMERRSGFHGGSGRRVLCGGRSVFTQPADWRQQRQSRR